MMIDHGQRSTTVLQLTSEVSNSWQHFYVFRTIIQKRSGGRQ